MPASTIHTPHGRVRTATKSPYVLVLAYEGHGPFIERRSASVDTLRTVARRYGIPRGLVYRAIHRVSTGEVVATP